MAKTSPITVETLRHTEDKRKNIPTAEHQSVLEREQKQPRTLRYPRNTDLDPQLVWRGKDEQDWSDLVVHAPPLYIQEKVHPKVLIEDLLRHSKLPSLSGRGAGGEGGGEQFDLFADFNGIPKDIDKTEFYQHDQNWSNRMILGDSLQVMASLAEREGLRGKVQCIYFDPPYGIKFNSNFQWSTASRDVKDGNAAHITREPEQVKAFRDTWRDGIHSYLTYLRDRLTVARDLLTDSGSIFVQIGDENVHRVRAVMDEVFGEENWVGQITVQKTTTATNVFLPQVCDYVVWYGKNHEKTKYRSIYQMKEAGKAGAMSYTGIELSGGVRRTLTKQERENPSSIPVGAKLYSPDNFTSASIGRDKGEGAACWFPVEFGGRTFRPFERSRWKTNETGMKRIVAAGRVLAMDKALRYVRFFDDFAAYPLHNIWGDVGGASDKTYVVQTTPKVIERCLLMATDPGDLVLDPTCGSGTTAYVSEQWGRRWITIDTSRVALALARARIMGARYPFYLLADSPEGHAKEASLRGVASGQWTVDSKKSGELASETIRSPLSTKRFFNNIRHGFVYERVPHITLKSIANNAEIDVIWDKFQARLEPLREQINQTLVGWAEVRSPSIATDAPPASAHPTKSKQRETQQSAAPNVGHRSRSAQPAPFKPFEEWEIPRDANPDWPDEAKQIHSECWRLRIARQQEIDASIAAKADFEYLYDKPYEDKKKVRVAGPFTVESLSPHRVLGVDEHDELIDPLKASEDSASYEAGQSFEQMILENLKTAGVQQAHKEDRITFTSIVGWPGDLVCAVGTYKSGEGIVNSGEKLREPGDTALSTNPSPLTADFSPELRAGIFIGPEFGTVSRPDLVEAAREAGDAGFDVLIACAFNYEAQASEFHKLGRIPVLKARMNADLHMAGELKSTGKGNLFVIFGEPDIAVASEEWLVDSFGNRVAPYDIYQFVSGLDRLAEINGLGRDDLCGYAAIARRREVWDYLADAARGLVRGGEHRRGSGAKDDGGVSPVAWYGARLAGGTGDLYRALREAGVHRSPEFRALVERLRGDQQDARRVDAVACRAPLTTRHYSQVTVFGVDVFDPSTGDIRSDGAEGIACWFIDTDYNGESFFVRQAYFLGQNDPYKALKTTLKAEINEEAWATLNSDTSRPFDKPKSGRIAVKVINHLGDEVMKVFRA
jgi:adenine-specific DNA-methyltransferase